MGTNLVDDDEEEKDNDLDGEDGEGEKEDTLKQGCNLVKQGQFQLVGCGSIWGTIDLKSFGKQVLNSNIYFST